MPSTPLYDRAGKTVGSVELSDALFAAPVNTAVLHQVVTAQLAARRIGTADTRTRGEIRRGRGISVAGRPTVAPMTRRPVGRSAVAVASRTARRAPAAPGRAASGHRTTAVAAQCSVRIPARTSSGCRAR